MEHTPDHSHRMLTVAEVQACLGLSRSTIWRRRQEKRFPLPCDIGNGRIRFRSDEIEAYVTELPRVQFGTEGRPATEGRLF